MNVLAAITIVLAAPFIWGFVLNPFKKKWVPVVCLVLTFAIIISSFRINSSPFPCQPLSAFSAPPTRNLLREPPRTG